MVSFSHYSLPPSSFPLTSLPLVLQFEIVFLDILLSSLLSEKMCYRRAFIIIIVSSSKESDLVRNQEKLTHGSQFYVRRRQLSVVVSAPNRILKKW